MSYSEDLGQLVNELTVVQLIQLAIALDMPAADLLTDASEAARGDRSQQG